MGRNRLVEKAGFGLAAGLLCVSCSKVPGVDPGSVLSGIQTASPSPAASPGGPSSSPTPLPTATPVALGEIQMLPNYRQSVVVSNFPQALSRIRSSSYSICGALGGKLVCKGEFNIFGQSDPLNPSGQWISDVEGFPATATLHMDNNQNVAAASGNTLYYHGNPCSGFPLLGMVSNTSQTPTGASFVFPDVIRRAEMNPRGTIAVLLNNGSLYFFGTNVFKYQIPRSATTDCVKTPVKIVASDVGNSKIIDVALNVEGGMLLTQAGKIYSWGSNRYGQVGNNLTGNSNYDSSAASSQLVQIPFPGGTPLSLVSSQGYNPGVIDSAGKLFMIGFDYSGQSCNGSASEYHQFNASPTFTPPAGTFIQSVAVGGSHTLVLTKNSSTNANALFACGSNVSGMFGDGSLSGSSSLKSVPLPVAGAQILDLSVGERNSYVLVGPAVSAVVFSAGNNHKAQIKYPATPDPFPNWTQVEGGR